MNKFFLAKQGLLFKFISIIFQNLIISPVLVFISFIVTVVIVNFYSVEYTLILKIIFLLSNIFLIIRSSLLLLYNDKIIIRTWTGAKQVIEIDNISSLKIIDYRETRNIIFNTRKLNPLIANCMVFFIPMGKFITFKNKFGRDVVIGVWNCNKLYNLLNGNILNSNIENASVEKNNKIDYDDTRKYGRQSLRCYVKMPLFSHIIFYFKHFSETIIVPGFIVLFLKWLMNANDIVSDNYIFIIIFAILSIFNYYNVIKVIVNPNLNTIRLHLFYNNNKNVIKYENLFDLKYVDSIETLNSLENDKSKFLICTPYCKNNISNLITFQLNNDIRVVLSLSKSHDIYQILCLDNN